MLEGTFRLIKAGRVRNILFGVYQVRTCVCNLMCVCVCVCACVCVCVCVWTYEYSFRCLSGAYMCVHVDLCVCVCEDIGILYSMSIRCVHVCAR